MVRYVALTQELPGAGPQYSAWTTGTPLAGNRQPGGIAPKPAQAIKRGADAAFLGSSNLALIEALLIRAHLEPDDFRIAVQVVEQPAHFADLEALITVTCSGRRISRTYFSGSQQFDWFVDLSDDIQAGVFS